ncbi:STAS domain-containing protein [Peribacillus kribbensis]|uniref:STAS domain-containing protein n=1 Tax=Peribacillus kribbensis TaxID=356658 RepID=UPI0004226FF4|nr:STAS domain-containing protein [Peribacillus kribbensis]
MEKTIIDILQRNRENLYAAWQQELGEAQEKESLVLESSDKKYPVARELFTIIFESLKKMDTEAEADLRQIYSKILQFNESINLLTKGFQSFRRIALKILLEEELTKDQILQIYNQIDRWFDPVISQVVSHCSEEWESTFMQQEETLRELSAPVIQLFENITVMPLIGTISERRAITIMENLLNGIQRQQAAIVFLDIRGVPVVDTFVAQSIIHSSRAANLLGAECIIVGIRPEIAQTIINLGIDLSEIRTYSSLNQGLLYAVRRLNISVSV